MKQSVSLITLGVSDYERAKAFYEAIGWSPAMDVEDTAFFQANGVVLVLWSRNTLAADMGIADEGARWGGVALAHNVASDVAPPASLSSPAQPRKKHHWVGANDALCGTARSGLMRPGRERALGPAGQ